MRHAVSISIGSSKRDWKAEVSLMGQQVAIERIGTDGDIQKAARLFGELDGKVDAFGVGGTDLGFMVDGKWHELSSMQMLREFIHKTPVVDGTGLKLTLERKAAALFHQTFYPAKPDQKVLIMTAIDRWGMVQGFDDLSYQCVYGDLLFSLGLPFPLRKIKSVKRLLGLLLPIVGRLPFEWLYPVGQEQEKRHPKHCQYFEWANIIAGDCHYIHRYMPERLPDKVVLTNTTTPQDREFFRQAGVKSLITSTPVLNGRSFGTNMMEAAILAAVGYTHQVDYSDSKDYLEMMEDIITQVGMAPQVMDL